MAQVGRVLLSDDSVKEFATPASGSGIATGPDNNLWITEGTGKIGRMTTAGAVVEFSITSGAIPGAIVVGQDGNLWFTEKSPNGIGRISP